MASTTAHKERNLERASEPTQAARKKAAALVDDAEHLVGEVLSPGRWPQERTVERFLEQGRLERLLSLYSQAMWLDATEPAYPWNLASTLRRLGQYELAAAFLARAIHTAERVGEEDFCGPDAYLALAEVAGDGGEQELALVAIARAWDLGQDRKDVRDYAQRVLADLRPSEDGRGPGSALLRLLEGIET